MKTVADFKRKMIVGSEWHATHRYIGEHPSEIKDLGVRVCRVAQSNSFALALPDAPRPSWCDWPKAGECTFNGNSVTITKTGFCELVYTLVKEA